MKFEKVRRVIAILAIVVLAITIITTFTFAILGAVTKNPMYNALWKGSLMVMIIVPVVLYAILLIYKRIQKGTSAKEEEK
ncbi:MAG: hypothetical protein IJF94_03180 [Eubacterium sp.]|nr:hypothetical protein [Eubacterium sp.]